MQLDTWLAAERGRTQWLAGQLMLSASLVTHWSARRKAVSAERCVPIERATGGAVRRWDLRPDDWHRIWPELIGAEGAPEPSVAPPVASEAA